MGESDIASEQRCFLLSVLNNLSHWHPFSCNLAQRYVCMSFNRAALIRRTNQWLLPIPQGHQSVTITRHCQQKMTPESQRQNDVSLIKEETKNATWDRSATRRLRGWHKPLLAGPSETSLKFSDIKSDRMTWTIRTVFSPFN